MTARTASILSALIVGIGMAGAPSFAQAETFQAWGHEFTLPGTASASPSVGAPTSYTSMPTSDVEHSAHSKGARHSVTVSRNAMSR